MVSSKRIPSRAPQPSQAKSASFQNNFVGGLKTEFTGLNFPENACTSTENCVFTLIGNVTRRSGIDFELNFSSNAIGSTAGLAINTYRWTNVGGDGLTQILVAQIGATLYFYQSTNSSISSPLSTTLLPSKISLSPFTAIGSGLNLSLTECQFTDGNGYLFVFHPGCDPFYCTFSAGTITASVIQIKIRDFQGIIENTPVNFRPTTLTPEHQYNLVNQGWQSNPAITITYTPQWILQAGLSANNYNFTVATGLAIVQGEVGIISGSIFIPGVGIGAYALNFTVVSYNSSTGALVLTIQNGSPNLFGTVLTTSIVIASQGTINTWFTAISNYPSNADIWWKFLNSSNAFAPTTALAANPQQAAQAPQGSVILSAFIQDRGLVTGIAGLTPVSTSTRPKTGTWFQGRIWFTGVDASFQATGDAIYQTWTENIYFSQIVTNPTQFGNCFQENDPAGQTFFALLPTDGGVVTIQGSGSIYKLVPVQNGLLVFAANGIWFITGSTGAGFSATDYVITKVSNIQSISSTSYINILGTIVFWNEEGIYSVATTQSPEAQAPLGRSGGGFMINNLCVGSILSFYQQIPLQSKKFVRGDYNPTTYTVKWTYRSTNESGVNNRWQFDSVLNYNTLRQSFYPYQVLNTIPTLSGINYVAGPGGSTSPSPTFKYLTSTPTGITFSEERDQTNWVDFFSFDSIGVNYTSFFQAGYIAPGQWLVRGQPIYLNMYFNSATTSQYQIQGVFDYVNDPQSGKYSSPQIMENDNTPFVGIVRKRHRIRGHGYSFQILLTSIPGQPFDIHGWSIYETKNAGV